MTGEGVEWFLRRWAMVSRMKHFEAGLAHILDSPRELGKIELIVRRPAVDQREVLSEAQLDWEWGLVGDNWSQRASSRTADRSPHPDMQINLMNSRVIAILAGERERWALAGDQFFVDLDLSRDNLPPGTRLALGSAVLVVTDQPHTGCRKFAERFGQDAHQFVNSKHHRAWNLRGINARVLQSGWVRQGDPISKIADPLSGRHRRLLVLFQRAFTQMQLLAVSQPQQVFELAETLEPLTWECARPDFEAYLRERLDSYLRRYPDGADWLREGLLSTQTAIDQYLRDGD